MATAGATDPTRQLDEWKFLIVFTVYREYATDKNHTIPENTFFLVKLLCSMVILSNSSRLG